MSTGAWVAILAGIGIVGYVVWRSASQSGTGLSCPDPTSATFRQILAKVASGETDRKTAETMAQGYDNGGCPVAASAIRAAMPISSATPSASKSPVLLPPKGAELPLSYTLTTADYLLGPALFAARAGFPSVESMAAYNSAIGMAVTDAAGAIGVSVFEEASPMNPSIVYEKKLSPWSAGLSVAVKKDPTKVASTGERARKTGYANFYVDSPRFG